MSKGRLLVVDDEEIALQNLEHVLSREGYDVVTATRGEQALSLLEKGSFDVVLTDLRMAGVDGMDVLRHSRDRDPLTEVIMITAHASAATAVEAMRQGAFYYLAKPFRLEEVRKVVAEAAEKVHLKRENQQLREQLGETGDGVRIVTRNAGMQRLLETARQIAPTDCNVLITGDSGTGKELLARYLHRHSARRDGPFVALNCGAFAESLLDNELFGHEKGAFTGAVSAKKGLIEAAEGGTLFLDEITEMSAAMQVKLLRVIQEREVLRVGATRPVRCDVRFVAASNRDITAAVRDGLFRQDLLYRLDVVRLQVPTLADRRDDVPVLALHFLKRFAAQMHRDVRRIEPAAMALLEHHTFPGNVRELENIVARGTAISAGDSITVNDLPETLRDSGTQAAGGRQSRLPTLEEQEQAYIRRILAETDGNQTAAAEILGINRASLWRKLKGRPRES
jgi:two-component system response regulator HydG